MRRSPPYDEVGDALVLMKGVDRHDEGVDIHRSMYDGVQRLDRVQVLGLLADNRQIHYSYKELPSGCLEGELLVDRAVFDRGNEHRPQLALTLVDVWSV